MSHHVTDLEVTGVTEDEFAAFSRVIVLAFGDTATDERIAFWRRLTQLDRLLAARSGGRIVGATIDLAFELSVPYAGPVACSGVTGVGVAPTHRRRGVLRRLMRAHLEAAHERGEPWAALYASESAIYGRFGYGVAVERRDLAIDRVWAAMAPPSAPPTVDLVEAARAADVALGVVRAVLPEIPGVTLGRDHDAWRAEFTDDPESSRDGAGPKQFAVAGDRGYAAYRITRGWTDTGPDSSLKVEQLVAVDRAATRDLWSFLLGIDLVGRISATGRPVDDPLPWWLVNRQRLRETGTMPMYVRLVDVGAALSSRGSAASASVVVEVVDEVCPWNARRWRIAGDGGALSCEPDAAAADVRCDVRELASVSLGGVAPTTLERAGLLDERTDGAVRRLEALLASPRPPWNPTVF